MASGVCKFVFTHLICLGLFFLSVYGLIQCSTCNNNLVLIIIKDQNIPTWISYLWSLEPSFFPLTPCAKHTDKKKKILKPLYTLEPRQWRFFFPFRFHRPHFREGASSLSLSLSPQHVTSRSRRHPWKLTVTAARLRRINQLPPQPSPFPLPLSLNFFLPKPKPNRSFPISRELRSKEEQGAAPDLAPPPSPGYPPSSPLVGSCGESPADLSCEFL